MRRAVLTCGTAGVHPAPRVTHRAPSVASFWLRRAQAMALAPDGRISRYLYGIDFPSKDFRLSLVEAADGKVGTSFDKLVLTCYRYDPATRKYEPYALGIVRAGAVAVAVALAGLIGGLVLRERRAKARHAA